MTTGYTCICTETYRDIDVLSCTAVTNACLIACFPDCLIADIYGNACTLMCSFIDPPSPPPKKNKVLANVFSYFIGLAVETLKVSFLALVASFKGVLAEGFTWWRAQAKECWDQLMQLVVGVLQVRGERDVHARYGVVWLCVLRRQERVWCLHKSVVCIRHTEHIP